MEIILYTNKHRYKLKNINYLHFTHAVSFKYERKFEYENANLIAVQNAEAQANVVK